jgi:hypothetical protein
MRVQPDTQKAAEAGAFAQEVAALPYRGWQPTILALLPRLEEEAAEQGKEQAFGLLLIELKQDLPARVSLGVSVMGMC